MLPLQLRRYNGLKPRSETLRRNLVKRYTTYFMTRHFLGPHPSLPSRGEVGACLYFRLLPDGWGQKNRKFH